MYLLTRIRAWAGQLKRNSVAVYFAARDSRTPVLVRAMAMAVAAYALSPIDLIPDFIPVLGYLDDLLIVPAGLWMIIRLLPVEVLADARLQADKLLARPTSRAGAIAVVTIWLICLAGLSYWWLNHAA